MLWTPWLWKIAGSLAAVALVVGVPAGWGYLSGKASQRPVITRLTSERDQWKAASEAWERAYRLSEQRRDAEARQAQTALAETAKACEARVTKARRSAAAIAALVTQEPELDQSHCPARRTLDARRVRDAIYPAAR